MARSRRSIEKAVDPYTDGSWTAPPILSAGMLFQDVGSTGLRQSGGWVREEFLRSLQGREALRAYREMGDNSPVVGSVLFAVIQVMRKVDWRDLPASDSPEAVAAADFARELRGDMSSPWEDHIVEALSMLQFGFAPCEIVYKRRQGQKGSPFSSSDASSLYDDGRVGIRRLPLRGQETVYKWFFDPNGQPTGLTQQPWNGPLIDIPIEKLLLYRPSAHKNNPEGRSILRTAYRPWYFMKRIEELEAILFERMGGLPVVRVPNALLEAAKAGDEAASAALEAYKRLATNVRVDEQMGIVMPSDVYKDQSGAPSSQRMYDFELKTPDASALRVDSDNVIRRYGVDILKSILADFIDLGHQARGTQSLAISKIDLFYTSIRGWLQSISGVINRNLYPRVWELNAMSPDTLPHTVPDLPIRVDLDVLGGFVSALARAGMPMFPDADLENYIRSAAGMPQITPGDSYDPSRTTDEETENRLGEAGSLPGAPEDVAKHLLGLAALEHRRSSRSQSVRKLTRDELDRAARRAAPRAATPAMLEAGNYPKGHVRLHGLDVSIETPRGTDRTGTDASGRAWSVRSPAHYGYVRRTKPGADGEAIDVYVGTHPEAETVWVVDQLHADTGKFDEHKAFLGFQSLDEVVQTYRSAFGDGKADDRLGAVHRTSLDGFKAWAHGDVTTAPLSAVVGKNRPLASTAL